jgi:site-specific recombinase XerD
MFRKFGWMILAHRKGKKDSIRAYIRDLKNLQEEIVNKHAETIDEDRRKDLEELLQNVQYLSDTAKKCLL